MSSGKASIGERMEHSRWGKPALAEWLLPSPTALLPGLAAGVSEVSRFSCMKFLGVPGVFDYAGLNKNSR
jgi:hypothetical protein